MADPAWIEAEVKAAVPDAEVHPIDLTGEGDHWFVAVVAPSFEGLRSFRRQRPVLDRFTPHFQSGAVHALDLKCITPQELQEEHGGKVPEPFHPHGKMHQG